MKQRHLLALLQSGYTTIQVVFEGSNKPYTYKARGQIIADDYVVVNSPSKGLVICKVVGVDKTPRIDIDADFTYQWIVQKVDTTEYNRVKEQEREFMDTLLEIERARQKDILMNSFCEHLPEGSSARVLFDNAVKRIGGEA